MKFSEKNLENPQKYITINKESNALIAEDTLIGERNSVESAEIIQYNITVGYKIKDVLNIQNTW